MVPITTITTGEDLDTIGIIIVLMIIMGVNGIEIVVIEATISVVANEIGAIMRVIVADITATKLPQDYQTLVTKQIEGEEEIGTVANRAEDRHYHHKINSKCVW